MSIEPLLNELYAMMSHSKVKLGLTRIQSLCERLDNPYTRYPSIHVAGTNGKGSTCAMISSILQCAGYNVGLYTSPHIRRFNERIRINNEMISDEDIVRIGKPLLESGREIDATFFEITTAMAFAYFAEHRVDVAILETGMGGRLDATNVVEPLASVITQIDYDHMEYLGATIENIALEKAGIIKSNVPVIVGQQGAESSKQLMRQIFEQRAAEAHTTVTFAEDVVRVEVDDIYPDLSMSVSVIDGDLLHYYTTSLAGAHQARNIATVMATLPHIKNVYFISEDHVRDGLRLVDAKTGIEGRVQLIRTDPTVVLDVSHNPSGVQALVDTLQQAGYRDHSWQVVFGGMRDKDLLGMLERLKPLVSTLHLCTPKFDRAISVGGLEQLSAQAGYQRISTHDSVADAVQQATLRGPVVVCGSFYVADEAVAAL
ncbi:MAG: bifunctional folylpolyglutamate synthase/dihydrofolate synthase [Ignavibacteria bacterium]|nr:bifunctional folylpolyglutamate synthase/dihydrofolate synthase [Ignavibacteria bacterium]